MSWIAAGIDAWVLGEVARLGAEDDREGLVAGTKGVQAGAVRLVGAAEPELLRSARAGGDRDRLAERITFGFALRDLSRRRVPVTIGVHGGRTTTGTLDRVGADHLDLALHALDAPRRSAEVAGFRMLPLAAVAWVRADADAVAVLP